VNVIKMDLLIVVIGGPLLPRRNYKQGGKVVFCE
jgi:hypothetical protein